MLLIQNREIVEKSWEPYKEDLNSIETQQLVDLNNLKEQKLKISKQLIEKKENSRIQLKKKKEELKVNLKNYEDSQIKLLHQQVAQEIQNCPNELRNYLTQENYSMITKKLMILSKEEEQLGNALTRELIKIGFNEQKFLETMDRNTI